MPQTGQLAGQQLPQRRHQAPAHGQLANGRALTAGNNQAIEAFQMFGQAHLAHRHAQTGECSDVFRKVALEGQHADSSVVSLSHHHRSKGRQA